MVQKIDVNPVNSPLLMCLLLCVGCSQTEQKIDRLQEMTAEISRRLLNREDTALQYKKCVLGCMVMIMHVGLLCVFLLVLGAVCWYRRLTRYKN